MWVMPSTIERGSREAPPCGFVLRGPVSPCLFVA